MNESEIFSDIRVPCSRFVSMLVVLLLVGHVTSANAQEWTRFRGPNGAGQSECTTIPTVWTEQDYRWRSEVPGVGNASPVLWGDRLFVLSADPANGTRYVLCLSANDGTTHWKREYPSSTHTIHVQNTLASSTPAADESRVYLAWSTPEEFTLLALNHDGSPAWRANLGPFASQHGFGTSPILFGELLIIANDQDADSFVIAVDRSSGVTKWKVPRKHLPEQNTCYATPCLFEPAGRPAELILCSRALGVTSLDPRSGETNWELPEVFERRVVASPIVLDGLILASCGEGSGNNSVVAVQPPADGQAAQVAFKVDKTSAPYVPSLVAKDQLLFLWGDRGIVSCLDARTQKVLWRERVGGNYYGSPVRVADCVYCVALDGQVVSLKASAQYELLGRSPLGETARSTPAVAQGRLFLRSESHVLAVGKR